jgi:hypothetical protein
MLKTLLAAGLAPLLAAQEATFEVAKGADAVVVTSGGKEVLKYHLQKPAGIPLSVESGCFFHPLATPAGTVLTDAGPGDHKHHRGVFLGWVEMHGKKDADFWGWGQHAPVKNRKVVNREVAGTSGGATAAFKARNEWMAEEASVLKEDLDAALKRQGPAHVLDLVYTLTPDADLRLARWAFSGFCLRARKDGAFQPEGPDGPVKLPAPSHLKPESDWPSAAWYGFTLKLKDGGELSGAVIDHPKNPPSLWHNAFSIGMVNPCIVAPKEVLLRAGEPLVLRYRVVAQDGALSRDLVNRLAEEWRR